MAVHEPSGITGYNLEKWKRTIEAATYQNMKFIPTIDDEERPYGLLHIRKHARMTAGVLTQSATGASLSATTMAGTPVTLTPAGTYLMVQWSENEDAQIDFSLDAEARGQVEQAMAEASDQSALAAVASGTQIMSQAAIDGPMLRQAYGRLMGNTNGMATPGEDPQVYAIFSHTQYPNLGTIPEFNSAEVRGDSENPYIKGMWTRGGGIMAIMTTVITQDANGWHNCLYIPSAFAIAWNKKTELQSQKFELTHKVIAYNNFGTGIKHDLRLIDLRTTASAL